MDHDCPDIPPAEGCGGCHVGRRSFLLAAAQSAAAVLGLGALPSLVHAAPVAGTGEVDERRYAIPPADGVMVDEEASLIVARASGAVYAFSLACPHKRAALRWQPGNGRFECPKHKSRYQPDGVFISGRATRSMDRYPIRRDGASIIVEVARALREDADAAAWQSAVVRL